MTENEAKTKLCVNSAPNWVSSTSSVHPSAACLGSACMAWRWLPRYGENPNNSAEGMSLPPTEGYCGLAGRP